MKKLALIAIATTVLAGCSMAPKDEIHAFDMYKLNEYMPEAVEFEKASMDICGDEKYDAYLKQENVIMNGEEYTEYLCITPEAYQAGMAAVNK